MGLREAYQEMHAARLRELDAEIRLIEAKAMQAQVSTRILYHEALQAIYRKRDAAQNKLESLKEAGDVAWQDFKHGLESAWHELRDGVRHALTQLKNH